jgi:phospho-2-dehydro-3-deoxyheptonate aldolase
VAFVERTRIEVRAVLDGPDDHMLVIAGPCPVHDSAAALDYAGRLAAPALGSISRRGTARRPRTHCDSGRLLTEMLV